MDKFNILKEEFDHFKINIPHVDKISNENTTKNYDNLNVEEIKLKFIDVDNDQRIINANITELNQFCNNIQSE
jgi:hypothetical protein